MEVKAKPARACPYCNSVNPYSRGSLRHLLEKEVDEEALGFIQEGEILLALMSAASGLGYGAHCNRGEGKKGIGSPQG